MPPFLTMMRWHRSVLLACAALALGGCRSGAGAHRHPAPASPQFVITAANASGRSERIEISVDGRVVVEADVAPRSRQKAVQVPVTPGWHRVETRTSGGSRHRAMVEGDRTKWIRVQREPSKPEGVGVHVTEYPQR